MRHGLFVTAIIVVALLTGCTAPPSPDQPTAAPSATPVDASDIVDEIDVFAGPVTATVAVYPLARFKGGLVLTLDIDPHGKELSNADLQGMWDSHALPNVPKWEGLRLLNLADDLAAPPAVDSEEDAVALLGRRPDTGGSASPSESVSPSVSPSFNPDTSIRRLQVMYGDPNAPELALFVPQAGVVTGIPVVEGQPPHPPTVYDWETSTLAIPAAMPVYPLTTYTVDTATQSREESQVDSTRIALGSDVLFDTDSAALTGQAPQVIAAAADSLRLREPGPVDIVGHTDSVDTGSYNQVLSEQRAQAVADTLSGLIDTQDYPLRVTGMGESQPVADNATDEGRAVNRRVELTITTPAVLKPGTEPSIDTVAPVDGQNATGDTGVNVTVGVRTYRVRAPSARVVDGHPIITIEVTATDSEVDSLFGPAIFEGGFPSPGVERLRTMVGIALMNGSTATLPALHQVSGAEPDVMFGLTDLATFSRIDGGGSRTSEIVYPAAPVGDTVTVRLLDGSDDGWQLTDIPVKAQG